MTIVIAPSRRVPVIRSVLFGSPSRCNISPHFPASSRLPLLYPPSTHQRLASSITKSEPQDKDNVNGPPTTLPPTLDLPSREPNQSLFSHLYRTGRTYLTFYKSGIKNLWTNYQSTQTLQQHLRAQNATSIPDAVDRGLLSRADFQLLERNRHDIRRVPPFVLVFLICGEFTPLVVPFMTGVVPRTCRIPSQIEARRKKLQERRRESFRNVNLLPALRARDEADVERLQRSQIVHIARSVGLYSGLWDRLEALGLPPGSLIRRRIRKWVKYLDSDDKLINKGGGAEAMDGEELRMALVERGVDVMGKTESQLRSDMKNWLRARQAMALTTLFLTRPSVWSDNGGESSK